jgi:hypothetical protein
MQPQHDPKQNTVNLAEAWNLHCSFTKTKQISRIWTGEASSRQLVTKQKVMKTMAQPGPYGLKKLW